MLEVSSPPSPGLEDRPSLSPFPVPYSGSAWSLMRPSTCSRSNSRSESGCRGVPSDSFSTVVSSFMVGSRAEGDRSDAFPSPRVGKSSRPPRPPPSLLLSEFPPCPLWGSNPGRSPASKEFNRVFLGRRTARGEAWNRGAFFFIEVKFG